MDKVNQSILTTLEQEGRISFSELGERVALSKTSCWKRVRALETDSTIKSYRAVLDPDRLGLGVRVMVQLTVAFGQNEAFVKAVQETPAVRSCYAVTGDVDYILFICAKSIAALDALLRNELRSLPGVERFSTSIQLNTIKEDSGLMGALLP